MRIHLQRHVIGQTPLGLFTNLWPTALNRRDRETVGGWYCDIHVGTWRLQCYQTR